MQLSPNFTLEEMIFSQTAARNGIDNSPDNQVLENLKELCINILEPLRTMLNHPIQVTSGYRCYALNAAVGGAPNSEHLTGCAADIVCPQFGNPLEVCRAIEASDLPFNQMIYEYGRWCHISYNGTPKREILRIAVGTGYQYGLP